MTVGEILTVTATVAMRRFDSERLVRIGDVQVLKTTDV